MIPENYVLNHEGLHKHAQVDEWKNLTLTIVLFLCTELSGSTGRCVALDKASYRGGLWHCVGCYSINWSGLVDTVSTSSF